MTLAIGGCSSGFTGTIAGGPFRAIENGRDVRLLDVGVLDKGNGWDIADHHLVEPCDSARAADPSIPCWPSDPKRIDNDLLRTLKYNERGQIPAYREPVGLLNDAESLNRDVGPGQHAFVLGTSPLIIAVLDRRGDLSGLLPEMTRVHPIPKNADPTRTASFVGDDDMDRLANVVVVFPQVSRSDLNTVTPVQTLHAQLTLFDHARPLREIFDLLEQPAGVSGADAHLFEILVRPW